MPMARYIHNWMYRLVLTRMTIPRRWWRTGWKQGQNLLCICSMFLYQEKAGRTCQFSNMCLAALILHHPWHTTPVTIHSIALVHSLSMCTMLSAAWCILTAQHVCCIFHVCEAACSPAEWKWQSRSPPFIQFQRDRHVHDFLVTVTTHPRALICLSFVGFSRCW